MRNYLNISLDYCRGFTDWFDGLLLLLIAITDEILPRLRNHKKTDDGNVD